MWVIKLLRFPDLEEYFGEGERVVQGLQHAKRYDLDQARALTTGRFDVGMVFVSKGR